MTQWPDKSCGALDWREPFLNVARTLVVPCHSTSVTLLAAKYISCFVYEQNF